MDPTTTSQIPSKKSKFSLNLPENLSLLSYAEETSSLNTISPSTSPNTRSDRDPSIYKSLEKTLEILSKSGEQRNPKDLRILMKSTEYFQYFQKLKEKPSTNMLHSRFCRVMKLRILKKGDTLFYAGKGYFRKYLHFLLFYQAM